MHNFCNNCKVEIDELIANCPLCGKCVNEKAKLNVSTQTSTYPNLQLNNTKKFPIGIVTISLFALTLIILALEFFITKRVHITCYAIASFIFIYFSILIPAKHNFSFLSTSMFIGVELIILFIELFSKTFGWGVNYVMPFISLAYSICNGILIIGKGYFNFEFYLPMLLSTVISTALLIVNYVNNWVWWPSISAFLFSWLVMLFVTFIRFKGFKKAMHKKFHF